MVWFGKSVRHRLTHRKRQLYGNTLKTMEALPIILMLSESSKQGSTGIGQLLLTTISESRSVRIRLWSENSQQR